MEDSDTVVIGRALINHQAVGTIVSVLLVSDVQLTTSSDEEWLSPSSHLRWAARQHAFGHFFDSKATERNKEGEKLT